MNIGTFYTTCKCQLKCHNHDVCKVVYILCGQILYNAIDDEQLFHTVSRETTCTGNVTLTSADPCKKNYVNMQEKIANMQANYV